MRQSNLSRISYSLLFIISLGLLSACDNGKEGGNAGDINIDSPAIEIGVTDEYTYAQKDNAVITHLDLDIKVDFTNKKISGTASFLINNITGTDKIYFDTKDLDIEKVTFGDSNMKSKFELNENDKFKGSKLTIEINPSIEKINIYYSTRPGAIALQWLGPQQTIEKKHPYLYTQSEPTLARSWIPIQDSPGIRLTYKARVTVPKELMAVMSATNPQEKNNTGVYDFEMKQPVPGYLMALAVGDFVFKPIGERTGVYAEESMVDAAVYEFGEIEEMIEVVEKLYGKYRWDRYDLIVLPPSFPFGGMENPRITFATPTIIAGDRSLVSLVAHELAHSWSGNLVTSATWNDFWINEGFTVYLERRIMEELYGKEYTDMLRLIGYQDLQTTLLDMGPSNPMTHLKLNLDGADPDEALSDIAYEKGALFLQVIEEAVGRKKFDNFLKNYFDKFAFQSMSSDQFVKYLKETLIKEDNKLSEKIDINSWVYGPGLPSNSPSIKSENFKLIDVELKKWANGLEATALQTKKWTTHEWLYFLRKLPAEISVEKLKELDGAYGFSNSSNSEIIAAWFIHVIKNNYTQAFDKLEQFLVTVGRRKFLAPLYKELVNTKVNKIIALDIYSKARPNYHAISVLTIDGILGWENHTNAN